MVPHHVYSLDTKEGCKVLLFISRCMMKVKWIKPILTRSLEEDTAGLLVLHKKIGVNECKEAFVITTKLLMDKRLAEA